MYPNPICQFYQSCFESEEDDNHHDGVGQETFNGMNEDVRSVVTNSYYGIDISMETSPDQTSHENNKSNEIERINQNCDIWLNLWIWPDIVKFDQNCEIWSKFVRKTEIWLNL